MTTDEPVNKDGPLRRTAGILTRIEIGIGSAAVLVILVLVFYQALQRYLPIDSIAWTGELSRFGLLWATFATMGVLITTNGHIALELSDSLRSPMAVRIIQVFALVIVTIVGAGLTAEAWELVRTQGIVKSPVLRMPMSWVYIPVLIGAISTVIRSIVAAITIAVHGPQIRTEDETEVASL